MELIIETKFLSKAFNETKALDQISFNVFKGEIFGLLGPSGSGKTTTIKILTSQLIPTSGEVKVLGGNIVHAKKDIYNHIGILTDNSGIYDRLTVFENLAFYADIHKVNRDQIKTLLKQVNLDQIANRQVKKLSKGMKQRVMLLAAILHKPKLLFLDEPTSSLDPTTAHEIHQLIRYLNDEGTTVFLTTHRMEEADKLCDRIAFLNQGSIVEIGRPQDLKQKHSNHKIQVKFKNDVELYEFENNNAWLKELSALSHHGQIETIHSMEPTIEDIFIKLTGRTLI